MELLTDAIKQLLPRIYDTESTSLEEKAAVCKFFAPGTIYTWYVVEGQPVVEEDEESTNDWEFFGLVEGHEREWGYFRLSDLLSVRGAFGLPVERDLDFTPTKIKEIFPEGL